MRAKNTLLELISNTDEEELIMKVRSIGITITKLKSIAKGEITPTLDSAISISKVFGKEVKEIFDIEK